MTKKEANKQIHKVLLDFWGVKPKERIDTRKAAEILGVRHEHLKNMRSRGVGPRWAKKDGAVTYAAGDIVAEIVKRVFPE